MEREALTREMAYEVGRYGQAGVAPAGTVLPCSYYDSPRRVNRSIRRCGIHAIDLLRRAQFVLQLARRRL
jgi:hypothetical protein